MTKENKLFIKDIALTTLILVLIAVIAGGILVGVNALTYMTDEEKANTKLASLYPDASEFKDIEGIELTNVDGVGSIDMVKLPANDSGDVLIVASGLGAYKKSISVMIIINDFEIKDILKFSSGETPGLGENAFKKEHYKQYLGKFDKDTVHVLNKKDPAGDIDAVTAATKTSTALNNAVNVAMKCYIDNYDKIIGGGSNE